MLRAVDFETEAFQHAVCHFPIELLVFDHENPSLERREGARVRIGEGRIASLVAQVPAEGAIQFHEAKRPGELCVEPLFCIGFARGQTDEASYANHPWPGRALSKKRFEQLLGIKARGRVIDYHDVVRSRAQLPHGVLQRGHTHGIRAPLR